LRWTAVAPLRTWTARCVGSGRASTRITRAPLQGCTRDGTWGGREVRGRTRDRHGLLLHPPPPQIPANWGELHGRAVERRQIVRQHTCRMLPSLRRRGDCPSRTHGTSAFVPIGRSWMGRRGTGAVRPATRCSRRSYQKVSFPVQLASARMTTEGRRFVPAESLPLAA
jgi:hypothetical protein